MKALMKYSSGEGNVALLEVDEPVCGDNQVKIEIDYCGVCGTDIHVLHDTFRNYPPVILGHEFSGTVVEVGRNVSSVRCGEKVTGLGATAMICGECTYCRTGYFMFCPKRRGMGHGANGALAQYAVMRPDQIYRIPEGMSQEEAALTEPFAAAVQAVTEITRVRIGDTVLVSGPGPIGLLCLKLLVAEGAKVIVAGAAGDDTRLQAARRMGAFEIVNVSEQKLSDFILEVTHGGGVDVGFECSGNPNSVRACIEAVRPLGAYTQVGICGRDLQFPIDQILYKQMTLRGSVCYTARTWDRVMRIYEQGRVKLDDLVTTKLPLSEWRTAFDLCTNKEVIKVLMFPESATR